MDKTVIESYAIRFKKKEEYLSSKDNFEDTMFETMFDKNLKGDYLYFNPTRQGLDKFGRYPYIMDCCDTPISELKNLWNFYKKYSINRGFIFMGEIEKYFDIDHPQIVKIQITRTIEVVEEDE